MWTYNFEIKSLDYVFYFHNFDSQRHWRANSGIFNKHDIYMRVIVISKLKYRISEMLILAHVNIYVWLDWYDGS